MTQVTVSPKFQVVIPRHARELLDLRPGQKLQVLVFDGRIEMIPVKAPQELRGFLRRTPSGKPGEVHDEKRG